MTLTGVDYSAGELTAAQCRANGIAFVCRYVSSTATRWNVTKTVRQSEIDDFLANGIGVVLVFESDADDALGGFDQGAANARLADAQARARGLAGCPVYMAVDFDAVPSQYATVAAYLDGASSVLGLSRIGAYGSHRVITRLFDGGHIRYGWPAYAWGGTLDSRAHLFQYSGGNVAGVSVDWNRTVSSDEDYGQYKSGAPDGVQPPGILEWISTLYGKAL